MRGGFVLGVSVLALSLARPARANDALVKAAAPESAPSKNLFYAELGGKAGLYGIGYERTLTHWLSAGAAASYVVLRGQQIATVSPYLHATIVRGERNALFTELGASAVHSRLPSPVDDWDGMSESGVGGFVSLGWERATKHLVLRTSASFVVGEGGATPWIGFAIGWRP